MGYDIPKDHHTGGASLHHSQQSIDRFTGPKDTRFERAFAEVRDELQLATMKFGSFASAHEGYAVLLEEVDELWDEVKKNQNIRSIEHLRQEAKQVAAMALRFMIDLT